MLYRTYKSPQAYPGGFRQIFGIAPQQYHDGADWRDIETEIRDVGSGSYSAGKTFFSVAIPKYANEVVQCAFGATEIGIKPVCGAVEARLIESNRVRYPDVYGPKLHLDIVITKCGARKEIIIENIAGFSHDLVFDFELIATGKGELTLDGRSLAAADSAVLSDRVTLDDGKVFIQKAAAWDTKGKILPVRMELINTAGKVVLRKTLAAADFAGLQGQITTDADIAVGTGDGDVSASAMSDFDSLRLAQSAQSLSTAGQGIYVDSAVLALYEIRRGFLPFDTSAIPSGSTVNAASLRMFVVDSYSEDSLSPLCAAVVNTTITGDLALGDFGKFGGTRLTDSDFGDSVIGANVSKTLNSSGRAAIQCGGVTRIGLRESYLDLDAQGIPNEGRNYIQFQSSEAANDPLLTVDYTSSPSQDRRGRYQNLKYRG